MITQTCPLGHEYEIDIDMACITEDTFQAIEDARYAHYQQDEAAQVEAAGGPHIRRKINPNRVRGSQFYKLELSASENGSQTLCGGKPTSADFGWGDTRYAKYLALVACETCKALR